MALDHAPNSLVRLQKTAICMVIRFSSCCLIPCSLSCPYVQCCVISATFGAQVAAYTSGKDSVSLLDCLLLEHILWQQPDQQARITDFLLSQISEDDGLQSADYILGSEYSLLNDSVQLIHLMLSSKSGATIV